MIILDTNVLSAMMRDEPDNRVTQWLNVQPIESIWITSISLFEVQLGIGLLPTGRKRQTLEKAFEVILQSDLENRILDFDRDAAIEAAALAAMRQSAGRRVDMRDTQIAGIAQSRRASLATRNIKHFYDLSVPVVNPWEYSSN